LAEGDEETGGLPSIAVDRSEEVLPCLNQNTVHRSVLSSRSTSPVDVSELVAQA
ncbi:hypothetical protein Ancab_023857, partial [Ancistrocladus abbreviatus]